MNHAFVAKLKKNHPRFAAALSRGYSLVAAKKNRRIVAASQERPLSGAIFWSMKKDCEIYQSELPRRLMEGDVVLAKNLLDHLAMTDEFSSVMQRGYGVDYSELAKLHTLLTPMEILQKTQTLKSDEELLALECTLLRSLFASEPELYAELMPNLRPHLPFATVKEVEKEIERTIGRGKMNAHGPHKDSWRFHPENTINVWLALSPVNALNGMFVLPESRDYCPKFANNEIKIGCQTYPNKQYVTEMMPGDALLFSAELLHGSVLNQTNSTRYAFSMRCTLEKPKFHRSFMYNYVRLSPKFSNLTSEKIASRNDFEPPSRDTYSASLGDGRSPLKIVSETSNELVLMVNGEERCYPRRCPHQKMDLKHGYLEDDKLVCPQHQLRISALGKSSF